MRHRFASSPAVGQCLAVWDLDNASPHLWLRVQRLRFIVVPSEARANSVTARIPFLWPTPYNFAYITVNSFATPSTLQRRTPGIRRLACVPQRSALKNPTVSMTLPALAKNCGSQKANCGKKRNCYPSKSPACLMDRLKPSSAESTAGKTVTLHIYIRLSEIQSDLSRLMFSSATYLP